MPESLRCLNFANEELVAAIAYRLQTGATYWDDLVATEKADGSHYLGRIGRIEWLAGFAPFSVVGDVAAVVEDCRTMLDLSEEDLNGIANGLTASMAAYDKIEPSAEKAVSPLKTTVSRPVPAPTGLSLTKSQREDTSWHGPGQKRKYVVCGANPK